MSETVKFAIFCVSCAIAVAIGAVCVISLVNWGRSHAYSSCIAATGNTNDCFEYAYDVKRERHDFTLNLGLKK